MQQDERIEKVDGDFVHFFQQLSRAALFAFLAFAASGLLAVFARDKFSRADRRIDRRRGAGHAYPAGDDHRKAGPKRIDHQRAQWIVRYVNLALACADVADMRQRLGRARLERGEPRGVGADHAPQHPQAQQRRQRVSGIDVRDRTLAHDQGIGDHHRGNAPMGDLYQRVPPAGGGGVLGHLLVPLQSVAKGTCA